jgi:RND family efflux transporter MFP subunit
VSEVTASAQEPERSGVVPVALAGQPSAHRLQRWMVGCGRLGAFSPFPGTKQAWSLIMQPAIRWVFPAFFLTQLLVLVGCSSEPPATEKKPPTVTWSKPIFNDKERDYDEFDGYLVPKHQVKVLSKVRGFVKEIYFKDPPENKPAEGEIVEEGDRLFDLDPEEFQDRIGLAKEKVNVYKAQKVAAKKELARLTELQKKGGASVAQVEKAEADVGSLEASIQEAQYEVSLRQRDLKEYAKIKAAIRGRISASQVSRGDLAKQGETLLATINSIDPIKVEFHMDEKAVQRYRKMVGYNVKDGKLPSLRKARIPFSFKLDTDEDFTRTGIIDFVDNQTDPKTGTILVRGETRNKQGLLIPGDHVRVRVPVSDEYEALLVPDTAVNTDQDQKYLLILNDKNVVERRDVRLGKLTGDGLRVIETNLRRTDRVIIEGTQRARIGKPVTPVHKDLAKEMKNLKRPTGR